MKPFVLIGGHLYSGDGQRHYISPRELCRLYKLDPRRCVFATDGNDPKLLGRLDEAGRIFLAPDATGKYELPNEAEELPVAYPLQSQRSKRTR